MADPPLTSPRVLVTGATGLLGPYLVDALASVGGVTTTARRSGDLRCDLTDGDDVGQLLARARPDVVVHTAALTDVEACQREPDRAALLNEGAVVHLVDALPSGATLVHISTDQVYPDTPGLHREGTEKPVNVYGSTKLAGERAALTWRRSLVVRTNFFGPSRTPGRESLSDFVTHNLEAGNPITLFEDVLFSPLHAATLAVLIAASISAGLTGVHNLGSRAGLSKYDFGMAVARQVGLPTTTVARGKAADLPARAPRPADLRMDVSGFEHALGTVLPTLREEIGRL